MLVMQLCVPERGGILEGFWKEQDICPKTCSGVWVEFRERKDMLIKYNISGNINATL
jgi:Zn-finger nucleic acid-binding protein